MIDQLEIRREAIGEVCRRYGVASLSVFGSAVDGSFDDERSDLDFLVTFDPAARMSRFEAFVGLEEALEDLFNRPVDLISTESIENPHLARVVDRTRHELYAA